MKVNLFVLKALFDGVQRWFGEKKSFDAADQQLLKTMRAIKVLQPAEEVREPATINEVPHEVRFDTDDDAG